MALLQSLSLGSPAKIWHAANRFNLQLEPGFDPTGNVRLGHSFNGGIIGEVDSMLSRMHSTGCAGPSEARVLDNINPLAKLAAKR
jgi:hypothetical protein